VAGGRKHPPRRAFYWNTCRGGTPAMADRSIADYEIRKRNFEAETSALYQKGESETSTDELRDLVKRREDARDLREMNAIIQEKKAARNKLQDKLDTMIN